MGEQRWSVDSDKRPPAGVAALAEQVERDGGRTLALYKEGLRLPVRVAAPRHARALRQELPARTDDAAHARPQVLPSFQTTFTKLRENIEAFDLAKIRYEDVQRAAVVVPEAAAE